MQTAVSAYAAAAVCFILLEFGVCKARRKASKESSYPVSIVFSIVLKNECEAVKTEFSLFSVNFH